MSAEVNLWADIFLKQTRLTKEKDFMETDHHLGLNKCDNSPITSFNTAPGMRFSNNFSCLVHLCASM
jgi:hypothetical protein